MYQKETCNQHRNFSHKNKKSPNAKCIRTQFGAGSQTWTGTVLLPRDFKSLVSADSTIPAWNVCYYIISKLQKQAFYFVIFIFLSDKSTWDMVHSYVLSHVRFHASIVDARNTNIVFAVILLCFVNPVNFTFMLLPQHGERIKINPNFVAALFLRFIKNKLHTQM